MRFNVKIKIKNNNSDNMSKALRSIESNNKTKVSFYCSNEFKEKLKIKCAKERMNISDFLVKIIKEQIY